MRRGARIRSFNSQLVKNVECNSIYLTNIYGVVVNTFTNAVLKLQKALPQTGFVQLGLSVVFLLPVVVLLVLKVEK